MSLSKLKMFNRNNEALPVNLRATGWLFSKTALVFLLFITVAYLAYGLFFVPALFMDDWTSVIERVFTDNAEWLDMTQRRPLLFSTFLLQYRLLGLNVSGYYFVVWSLYVLMAILLYAIVSRFSLAYKQLFGLVIALLFLVYPTTYTHMYLIMLGIYCAIVLTLLYGYLLLRFAQGGHWFTLALALICLLISLGLYEGQVGIASAWALILILINRKTSWMRRLSLLIPIGLMGLFSLWRTVGFQATGVADTYFSQVVTSPSVLFSRLLLGYRLSLVWGWTSAIEEFLPWVSGAKIAVLLLFGVVIILLVLSYVMSRYFRNRQEREEKAWSLDQRWTITRLYLFSAIAGVALIGAGYVPFLTVFLPSLSGIGSRFNIFATIGGAVFIASVLMIGTLLLARDQNQVKYMLIASAAPFVILGIITQASVQYNNRIAWREQQTVWQELFSAAPDFKDDTMVLFILPGHQDRTGFYNWRRTPLSASWEASSGVRLLYNNSTLSADVLFPDIEEPIEPILTDKGMVTQDTGTVTPYARMVAFILDNDAGSLKQLDKLPAELIQGATEPVKLCADCVSDEQVLDAPLRNLIQD